MRYYRAQVEPLQLLGLGVKSRCDYDIYFSPVFEDLFFRSEVWRTHLVMVYS